MYLFNADAKIFLKFSKKFFAHKKLKNYSQKLLIIPQIHSFFHPALTAQTAQTEEFLFQCLAY